MILLLIAGPRRQWCAHRPCGARGTCRGAVRLTGLLTMKGFDHKTPVRTGDDRLPWRLVFECRSRETPLAAATVLATVTAAGQGLVHRRHLIRKRGHLIRKRGHLVRKRGHLVRKRGHLSRNTQPQGPDILTTHTHAAFVVTHGQRWPSRWRCRVFVATHSHCPHYQQGAHNAARVTRLSTSTPTHSAVTRAPYQPCW